MLQRLSPLRLVLPLLMGLLPRPGGVAAEEYYDLGGFHQPMTTDVAAAQTWFDRGLAMCQAFNHEEAVRCFERALAADPGMPMAYWGLAYAWGPNMNHMDIDVGQMAQAQLAIRLADLHAGKASTFEQDLITALARRYAMPVPEQRESLNQAYAEAMRKVYRKYPADPLVAALFAESLINLQPWKHFARDGTPAAHTTEIKAVLERALEHSPQNAALCHLYIHTMELSPHPEKALPAANRLRDAMPGAGHLVHMPTHIDVLVGDYANVIKSNQRAIDADQEYVKRQGANNFYTLYRIHNYHFLVYGAMFDGRAALALKRAREMVQQIPEPMLKAQTDFFDAFMPLPLHVLIRFGRWEAILNESQPPAYLPMSQAIWHYARALAYAATGRVDQARKEQKAFLAAQAQVPPTSILFNNSSADILKVAEAMVAGEIAYREGNMDSAFHYLREAVNRDDALNYDEPWGWMQPARHALGALFLEQGRVADAEVVYRADLNRHPKNPWALHGLAEALDRQGKVQEAAQYRVAFTKASERSDVTIDRSCYCRTVDGFPEK